MSTEIASASLVKHIEIPGLEDFLTTDFRVSRWRIVQTDKQAEDWKTGTEALEKGTFFNIDTLEVAKTLTGIVAAAIRKPRGYNLFDFNSREAAKAAGEDVTDICRSDNGIKPNPNSRVPQSTSCIGCPHAQFTYQNNQAIAPKCREMRSFHLLERESATPSVLTVQKEACPIVDKALQPLVTRRTPPLGVPLTISTVKKVGGKNVYWLPVVTFDLNAKLSDDELANLQELASGLAALFTAVQEQETGGGGEEEQGGGETAPPSSRRVVNTDAPPAPTAQAPQSPPPAAQPQAPAQTTHQQPPAAQATMDAVATPMPEGAPAPDEDAPPSNPNDEDPGDFMAQLNF